MWNGTQFVLMATYNNAIDPRPKKASQNLVTSGGVFDNMGALDVSELNATENPHTLAKHADLSAALAAIPTDYQKGGMSIKFVQSSVQSSDNKYIQARCMAQNFTTDVTQWQVVDDEPTEWSDNLVKSGGVYKDLYGVTYNISSLTAITYFDNNGTWMNNAQYKGVFIDAVPGGKYILKANSNKPCWLSVLTQKPTAGNQSVQYASIVGKDDAKIYLLAGQQSLPFVLGNDAVYIWISTQYGAGNNNIPELFKLENGIADDVKYIKEDVSRIDSELSVAESDIVSIETTLYGGGGSEYINLAQYTSQQAFPYQGKWIVNAQYLGKIIPCVAGDSYTFSNAEGTNTSAYMFLKSNNVVSGQDVDFAGGLTTAVNVLAGTTTEPIVAPSDANYLWVATQNGANTPCEMTSIYHQASGRGLTDDVEDLQTSVTNIESDVTDVQEIINGSGESGYIDLSDYATGQNYINAGKWFVNAQYLGKLIPCIGGDTYIISNVGGTNTAMYAFTKDNNVVAGESVNFATGSSATNILVGDTAEVIAPSDAAYLWICTQNGAGINNTPTSIYHQSNSEGLVQRVQALTTNVQDLDERVDELTASNIITTVRQFPNNDLPVVSFIFDDIVDNDEQIVSLFDEYGLTCGFAFVASTDKIATYKDKYLAWQRRGYSILNHSIDGNPINTTTCPTINDAYAKVATAKSRLEKAGFVVNGWVSPSNTFPVSNPDYSDVLKNLMAYGYVGSSTNTRTDNPCLLSRLSLQTTLLSDILDTNPNNQSSIAFYVAVNRQLTFYGHAADFGNSYSDEVFNIAKIRSVIERCISLRDTGKLAILSPDDMCRYFFRS